MNPIKRSFSLKVQDRVQLGTLLSQNGITTNIEDGPVIALYTNEEDGPLQQLTINQEDLT